MDFDGDVVENYNLLAEFEQMPDIDFIVDGMWSGVSKASYEDRLSRVDIMFPIQDTSENALALGGWCGGAIACAYIIYTIDDDYDDVTGDVTIYRTFDEIIPSDGWIWFGAPCYMKYEAYFDLSDDGSGIVQRVPLLYTFKKIE